MGGSAAQGTKPRKEDPFVGAEFWPHKGYHIMKGNQSPPLLRPRACENLNLCIVIIPSSIASTTILLEAEGRQTSGSGTTFRAPVQGESLKRRRNRNLLPCPTTLS